MKSSIGKLKTRGEGNAQAKLNEKQVRAIRRAYDSGVYFLRELAHHYDISLTQIHRIVTGENWAWVSKSRESNKSVVNKLNKST